jgi:hypothetical protein
MYYFILIIVSAIFKRLAGLRSAFLVLKSLIISKKSDFYYVFRYSGKPIKQYGLNSGDIEK